MCNLNILIKRKSKRMTQKRLINTMAFLQSVTAHSYASNKDADGVFFSSGKIVRQNSKINYGEYMSDLKLSSTVMSHQRWSTSGPESDVHPFVFGDLVMAHNGVMTKYATDKNCDSYNFFEIINNKFEAKLLEGLSREEALVFALKSELDGVYAGSYSISIYDRKTNNIYYFKNSGKSIYIYGSKSYLYLTTNASNNLFLDFLEEKFSTVEADDLIIYKIVEDEEYIDMVSIGTISKVTYKTTNLKEYGVKNIIDNEEEGEYDPLANDITKYAPEKYVLVNDDSDITQMNYVGYCLVSKWKTCLTCNCVNTKFRQEGSGDPKCEWCIGQENDWEE